MPDVPFPTPATVKNRPLSAALKADFAAVDDADVQEFIDNAASFFGSAEVKRHTRRNEAVLLAAAHLLYLQLQDEGALSGGGGGGGGGGVLSSVRLDGVGSKTWAVAAFQPEQLSNWLLRPSPFLTKLKAILDTFPPGIATAAWPCGGPTASC